jgi:hypothetical protein
MESREDLYNKIRIIKDNILKKKADYMIDLVYFILCFLILFAFITIISFDLYATIRLYMKRKDNIQKSSNSALNEDDNEYPEVYSNIGNELNKLEESLMENNIKQNEKLKRYKEWREKHNIKNANVIDAQVDMNVIDSRYDDYNYNKDSGDNFFKMLLMPPKYHELVNNSGRPYIKFRENLND